MTEHKTDMNSTKLGKYKKTELQSIKEQTHNQCRQK